MLEYLRDQFEREDTGTMVAVGLALSVTGTVLWSGAGEEGISSALGITVSALGVAVLLATVVWGGEES